MPRPDQSEHLHFPGYGDGFRNGHGTETRPGKFHSGLWMEPLEKRVFLFSGLAELLSVSLDMLCSSLLFLGVGRALRTVNKKTAACCHKGR